MTPSQRGGEAGTPGQGPSTRGRGRPGRASVPSRWHYVVGAGIIVVGFLVALAFLVKAMFLLPAIQVVLPGTQEFELPKAGKYQVFHEYRSKVGDKVFIADPGLPDMLLRLQRKGSAEEISLTKSSGISSYERPGRAGVSVLEFRAGAPGAYLISGQYEAGRSGPEVVFAIGNITIWPIVVGFFGPYLGGLTVGGLIIIRAVILRRSPMPPASVPSFPPARAVKRRNMWLQAVLYLGTFGLYGFYWYYVTYREMRDALGLHGRPALWTLLLLVPFAGYYALWRHSKMLEAMTNKTHGRGMVFVLWLFFSPAAWAVTQSELNRLASNRGSA